MEHKTQEQTKKEWMLPASIVFAAIVIAAAFMYAPRQQGGTPAGREEKAVVTAPAVTDNDGVLGNADAPITIIEYGDFQCPGCVSFFVAGEPIVKKELVETGQAKFVFRPYPIVDQIVGKGTESVDASLALLCARDQGKFWEMHKELYTAEQQDEVAARKAGISPEGNGNLNKALFVQIAQRIGADTASFTSCYDARTHADELQTIIVEAQEAGVRGTPTLFVNGVLLDLDSRAYPTWQAVVEYIKTQAAK